MPDYKVILLVVITTHFAYHSFAKFQVSHFFKGNMGRFWALLGWSSESCLCGRKLRDILERGRLWRLEMWSIAKSSLPTFPPKSQFISIFLVEIRSDLDAWFNCCANRRSFEFYKRMLTYKGRDRSAVRAKSDIEIVFQRLWEQFRTTGHTSLKIL
jgi:hypothetical protein